MNSKPEAMGTLLRSSSRDVHLVWPSWTLPGCDPGRRLDCRVFLKVFGPRAVRPRGVAAGQLHKGLGQLSLGFYEFRVLARRHVSSILDPLQGLRLS